MASTYTTNLRLTKQGDGENPNSWGQILNDGVISLADEAIAGYTTISIGSAATVNLTANDGADDQSRSAFLEVIGQVGATHTSIFLVIPNKSKSYSVLNKVSANATSNVVIMRVAGSAGVTLTRSSTQFQHVVCDGTSVYNVAQSEPTFSTLEVTGAATFDSTVTVSGASSYVGAATFYSTVTVSGAAVFKSNVSIGGTITGPGIVPSGTVLPYAGATAPTGYLLSFGQSLVRSGTYADLFSAIGTTYGAVDATHFNVPDLRGRVAAGQDDMGGTSADRLTLLFDGDVLGQAGGSQSHTLTTAQLAAHTHGAGTYEIQTGGDAAQASDNGAVFRDGPLQNSTAVSGDSGSTGSGTAHNNVQPTIILNYIIKT
jgi:microcystin-dependent protein/adenosine/AMP kinase